MFQKFTLSFKSKAFEFFSDESEKVSLLNSPEKFIVEQKFAAVKPAPMPPVSAGKRSSNAQFNQTLIASLFATVSSLEASYLQLQNAHVPSFDEEAVKNADKALVSHLQTLSEFKQLYKHYYMRLTTGESSFHLFRFIMCIGAMAARALKSMVQGILLSFKGKSTYDLWICFLANDKFSKSNGALEDGILKDGSAELDAPNIYMH
ncbi:hypothetical protein Cgig2_031357 [Carnegiea gigantea]|uniref:DUF641 domain-containing protein n=1 Tax=Carnegiea gigantea TaxID=171969 RepID=A0A9Q1JQD6_9CARY|nr:hypothetical protein Cgig2_031357 [Carnegiea gigantea]